MLLLAVIVGDFVSVDVADCRLADVSVEAIDASSAVLVVDRLEAFELFIDEACVLTV